MTRTPIRTFLILACTVLALSLSACSAPEANESSQPAYVSPYDWSGLVFENDRFAYYEDNELRSLTGIDVSTHQGTIDWNAVAADGIDFAMVRIGNRGATEGAIYLDEQYEANVRGASGAGIDVGVYFFSQAVSAEEAEEEADFVIAMLGATELDYPVVYDHEPVPGVEGRANNLSRTQMTDNARAFCAKIAEAGFEPMLYGNKRDIAQYDLDALGDIEVWFAEYGAPIPSGQFDFTIWQYSNSGTVAGIETAVDLNIRFLTEDR